MDARFGSTSPYFRVFAYGKSESRLDGIGWDNFQKAKLLRVFFAPCDFSPETDARHWIRVTGCPSQVTDCELRL